MLIVDLSIVLDRDGDGIPDVSDNCPDTPGSPRFNGCPDSDGDGIEDREDCCPDTPGLATLRGCPDTDKDGFPDSNDEARPTLPQVDCCPNTPGTLRGCPDADGDGFPDNPGACSDLIADACPEQPCAESGNGCPTCRTEYEKCTKTETYTEAGETKTRTIEYDCNPHEVCTCP